ncbi:membrane protein containing Cytochrome b/b6 [Candidatus Magnetobacterium bavaricum]|uniref:Membrane protein containing Cytochrome b/b6 n=1 Tax=Candidatus Magnetobacterium bavaricum TaxID=29290 RepID=A0A0F3GRP9_9BACT|nr:membrane protein containing Cytochrome b/b6 [Candidatus Magnetobacterium bavaricum]
MPENDDDDKRFYPEYLFEILCVVVCLMTLLTGTALLMPQEMGRRIVLSTPFQPKPEWYFLWLFELLKYFPGRTAFIGTVVLPLTFVAALLLVPFIDKDEQSKGGRMRASAVMVVLYLLFLIFTIIPLLG